MRCLIFQIFIMFSGIFLVALHGQHLLSVCNLPHQRAWAGSVSFIWWYGESLCSVAFHMAIGWVYVKLIFIRMATCWVYVKLRHTIYISGTRGWGPVCCIPHVSTLIFWPLTWFSTFNYWFFTNKFNIELKSKNNRISIPPQDGRA